MTPQNLISECRRAGVAIRLDSGTLTLKGAPDAVKSMAERMRPHKPAILAYLSTPTNSDPEVWGEFTPYVCCIGVEAVHELHALLAEYAAIFNLAEHQTAKHIERAKRQSLASIPATIQEYQSAIRHTKP